MEEEEVAAAYDDIVLVNNIKLTLTTRSHPSRPTVVTLGAS